MRRFLLALSSLLLLCGALSTPVSAAELPTTKNKGLYISPLRNYLSLDAGDRVTRSFTAANLTDQPMDITVHLERFSMVDYSYDFRFDAVDNDWIKLIDPTITLKPYQSHEFAYTISLPPTAAPGGYYYTLFASTTIKSGATTSTLRAASLLYLTVKGELSYTFSTTPSSLPYIVLSPTVDYSIDIKNTGNTHYFALVSSHVDGLFYSNAPNGTSQLLMPAATRHVNASITSPLIPGIYRLTYIVTPDHGTTYSKTRYFIFLPPWSLIATSLIGLLILWLIQRRKTKLRASS